MSQSWNLKKKYKKKNFSWRETLYEYGLKVQSIKEVVWNHKSKIISEI